MNRQYIGARYVPVYFNNGGSAEWVSGIGYEPLTIVTYLGRTYTSTKPVPSNIGSPNQNPTYWVESGDTQTLNNLINAIEEVDGKVDDLKDDTDDKFDTVNDSIDTINNTIDGIVDDIADINARIGVRKYLFVGDSYALMNDGGWLSQLVSLMGLTSSDYYTACVSGSAFTSQTPNLTWLSMVTSVVNGLSDTEKNNITDVVCIGGINDALPYTSFPNCNNDNEALVYTVERINEFAIYVKSNLPNAKISLFYVGNTEEGMDSQGQRYYSNIIRSICAWQNASYLNLTCYKGSECILHNYTMMSSDGIHPSSNGQVMIARFVNNCLLGGNGIELIDNFNTTSISVTSGSAPSAIYTNGNIHYTIINNMVNITFNGSLSCAMNETTTYSDGDEITIGALSNPDTLHGKRVEFEASIWFTPNGSTSGTQIVSGILILDKGVLKLKIWKLKPDWSTTTGSKMKWLIINIPNVTYPLVQN